MTINSNTNIIQLCNDRNDRLDNDDGGFNGKLNVKEFDSDEGLSIVDNNTHWLISSNKTIVFDPIVGRIPIGAGTGNGVDLILNTTDNKPYQPGSIMVLVRGLGFLFPNNSIVTDEGVGYDFTETSPTGGTVTLEQILNEDYVIYGILTVE